MENVPCTGHHLIFGVEYGSHVTSEVYMAVERFGNFEQQIRASRQAFLYAKRLADARLDVIEAALASIAAHGWTLNPVQRDEKYQELACKTAALAIEIDGEGECVPHLSFWFVEDTEQRSALKSSPYLDSRGFVSGEERMLRAVVAEIGEQDFVMLGAGNGSGVCYLRMLGVVIPMCLVDISQYALDLCSHNMRSLSLIGPWDDFLQHDALNLKWIDSRRHRTVVLVDPLWNSTAGYSFSSEEFWTGLRGMVYHVRIRQVG